MKNSGKLVIVAIVVVALGAAAFAAWYQYRGQKNALDFWGTTSAVLIAEAPQISIFELGEAGPAEQDQDEPETTVEEEAESAHPTSLEYGDRAWKVRTVKPGHEAPGIKNIRRALVQDTTFDWTETTSDEVEPEWQYAIAFTDNRNWATVLFDFETGRVALTGGKKSAPLDPAANKDLREFFAEQFADSKPADQPTEPPADQPPAGPDAPTEDKPAEETPPSVKEELATE
jgi:hypothetical protein